MSHVVLIMETVHVSEPFGRPTDGACLGSGFDMVHLDVLVVLSVLGLAFDAVDKLKCGRECLFDIQILLVFLQSSKVQ